MSIFTRRRPQRPPAVGQALFSGHVPEKQKGAPFSQNAVRSVLILPHRMYKKQALCAPAQEPAIYEAKT